MANVCRGLVGNIRFLEAAGSMRRSHRFQWALLACKWTRAWTRRSHHWRIISAIGSKNTGSRRGIMLKMSNVTFMKTRRSTNLCWCPWRMKMCIYHFRHSCRCPNCRDGRDLLSWSVLSPSSSSNYCLVFHLALKVASCALLVLVIQMSTSASRRDLFAKDLLASLWSWLAWQNLSFRNSAEACRGRGMHSRIL